MFCEKCGTKLPEGSQFCMNCGAKAAVTETVQEAAAQEAAISVDSPVLEAGPANAGQDSEETSEEKTSLAQDIAAETVTVQPIQIKAMPEQGITGQPITMQADQPKQAPVQQPAAQTVSARQTAAATQTMPASQSTPDQQYTTTRPTIPQAPVRMSDQIQQDEPALKPEKIKPLQTWKFIGMFIITAIPVINLIMVLIWSFSGGFNKNTRNFARATLILWIVGLVLLVVTAIVNWALIQYIWTSFSSLPTGITP